MMHNTPRAKGIIPFASRRQLPEIRRKEKMTIVDLRDIFFAGIGLFLVLSIIESCSLSVY